VRGFLKKAGWLASVFAIFTSCGGHWMALQAVAWGRMLASNVQTDSLAVAVEKTFDGDHPCPMCQKISAARAEERREQQASAAAAPARVLADLMCLPVRAAIPAVSWQMAFHRPAELRPPADRADPPPTPPPCGATRPVPGLA
jgi:hypothetical protein